MTQIDAASLQMSAVGDIEVASYRGDQSRAHAKL